MSVIVFPLATAASALLGWRRRSAALFGLAGLLGLISLLLHVNVHSDLQSWLGHLWHPHAMAWLVLSVGAPWAVARLLFRLPDKRRRARTRCRVEDLRGVELVVGRVLDTHDADRAWHVPHGNWLYDLNRDVHVNYNSVEGLQAWPGHVIGMLHCKGRCLLAMNFSTGIVRPVPASPASTAGSLVQAALLVACGAVVFPLLMLMSPLVWVGVLGWTGKGGLYSNSVAPGSHQAEACLTYGGGLAYALFVAVCLNTAQAGWWLGGALLLGVWLLGLHQYVLRTCARRHEQVLRSGVYQLKELHEQGMARRQCLPGPEHGLR